MRKQAVKRKMRPKMSIRSGDQVVVIVGKDRGKRGRVESVIPESNRLVVENVNMVKRNLRRQPGALQAGIIDKPAALNRSNVMLICPHCGQPTRESRQTLSDGSHTRVCKKCNEIVDRREQ